jgi:zinc transport system substrate-binding protein
MITMTGRRLRWLAAVLPALLVLGCRPVRMGPDPAGRPEVLAAFYPYYWLAQRIGGPEMAVGLITAAGAEPHDLELSPRQVAAVGRADLVIYERYFQPALDQAIDVAPPKASLDAGAVVLGNAGKGADPHLWLDPVLMRSIAQAVGEVLTRLDPVHSADHQQRTTAVVDDLTALDHDYTTGLAGCANRQIVTNHEAFGRLARRYGLTQIGVTGLNPEEEPSPRRLAELVALIRRDGVGTVYTETLATPRIADTLARETGATTATLDPLEGLLLGSTEDYLSIMRANLAALRTGLHCGTAH